MCIEIWETKIALSKEGQGRWPSMLLPSTKKGIFSQIPCTY